MKTAQIESPTWQTLSCLCRRIPLARNLAPSTYEGTDSFDHSDRKPSTSYLSPLLEAPNAYAPSSKIVDRRTSLAVIVAV
jgi:hypothetical protein